MKTVQHFISLLILLLFLTAPLLCSAAWHPAAIPPGGTVNLYDLTTLSSGHLLLATSNGIFRSIDHGASWQASNSGFEPPYSQGYPSQFVHGKNDALYVANNFKIYRSTDKGNTWEVPSGSPGGVVYSSATFLAASGSSLFAVAEYRAQHPGLYRSDDGGQTWVGPLSKITEDTPEISFPALLVASEDMVVVTEIQNRDVPPYSAFSTIYRSTDKGNTWGVVTGNLSDSLVDALIITKDYILASSSTGLFRMPKTGTTWAQIGTDLIQPKALKLLADGTILASTSNGIYHSTDQGQTWTPLGLQDKEIYFLDALPTGEIFAGNQDSLYVYTEEQSSDVHESVAQTLHLKSILPNPATVQVMLHFSLTRPGKVTFRFLNSLGQNLATLLVGQYEAGEYEVPCDIRAYGSGIYFCMMEMDGFSTGSPLLLIR